MSTRNKAFESVDGLLDCLADAASVNEGTFRLFEKALIASSNVPWKEASRHVARFPVSPRDPDDAPEWLESFARLLDALRTLENIENLPDSAHELGEALSAKEWQASVAIEFWPYHALVAADADARRGDHEQAVEPWTWIRPGRLNDLVKEGEAAIRMACRAHLRGQLHPEDEKMSNELFDRSPQYRELLMEELNAFVNDISLLRTSPTLSLDVVRDDKDFQCARPVIRVHIPGEGEVAVYQTPTGTVWKYPDGSSEAVDGSKVHTWKVGALEFETRQEVLEPSELDEARAALGSLRALADGRCLHRADEVMNTINEMFAGGAAQQAIETAHQAFEQGADLSGDQEMLLELSLKLRVSLPDAMFAVEDSGREPLAYEEALFALDEKLEPFSSAALMLDESVYAEIVEGIPVDEGAWWGHPEKVRKSMSDQELDEFLRAGRASPSVVSLDAFRRRRNTGSRDFSRERLRLAAATAEKTTPAPCLWWKEASELPLAGTAPVLLLDVDQQRGIVAELRVTVSEVCSESELWKNAPELRSIARESIRDAYFAAAASTPHGVAPYAFGQHRLELVIASDADPKSIDVEGRSLGLSAALAFASAWAGKPIATNFLPSATVSRRGHLGETVALDEKVLGASEYASIELRAIVAASQDSLLPSSIGVSELKEALNVANLDLSQLQLQGSAHQRLTAAQKVAGDVKNGNLASFGEFATWVDAGDQLSQLVSTLDEKVASREQLVELKCWAALAYSHAGVLSEIGSVLAGVHRDEAPTVSLRTLIDIVQLGRRIDTERLDTEDGKELLDSLTKDITELRDSEDRRLLGSAVGTLGRAHLHSGDAQTAKPLLQEAAAAHASDVPHEVPRSRVYLSMALRALGESDEALRELEKAEHELPTLTREFSPEYEEQCRMYLDYEKARVLLSLERPNEALESTVSALGATAKGVWWPALGILRTRAQAFRALDRTDEADACVEAVKKLGGPTSGEMGKLVSAIIAEAGRTYSVSESTY